MNFIYDTFADQPTLLDLDEVVKIVPANTSLHFYFKRNNSYIYLKYDTAELAHEALLQIIEMTKATNLTKEHETL